MEATSLNIKEDMNNNSSSLENDIYEKLKEAEEEMNTTKRYSEEEVLESMNAMIE